MPVRLLVGQSLPLFGYVTEEVRRNLRSTFLLGYSSEIGTIGVIQLGCLGVSPRTIHFRVFFPSRLHSLHSRTAHHT